MVPYLIQVCFVISLILPLVDSKLPDWGTLCPYNDFCTTKATKKLNPNETNMMPCCQKCSCEPDCQVFGNCCPDKELTPGVVTKYPCISVDLYYNGGRGRLVSSKFDLHFHVINDCPNNIIALDYPRCTDLHALEDYVFVSDPLTGRVYQNGHCAMCNGVDQYTKWLLITDCPAESEGLTREEWFYYVKRHCQITPIPPDSTSGQASRCIRELAEKDVRKCNHTGSWDTLDTDIEDACKNSSPQINYKFLHMSYTRQWTSITTYQNAYCELCNTAKGDEWPDLCSNLLAPFSLRGGIYSFSVIINFRKDEPTPLVMKCSQAQLWDPYKETCMAVTCPVSSLLVNGKCEYMYKVLTGNSPKVYDVIFHIKKMANISIPTLTINQVLMDLHDVISGLMNNLKCLPCQSNLLIDTTEEMYLEYAMMVNQGCTKKVLVTQILKLLENPYRFYYVRLLSEITLVPDLDINRYYLSIKTGPHIVRNCQIGIHLNWRIIDPCARVPLTYLNINTSSTTIKTERNNTICVHEYFKIMKSLNGCCVSTLSGWIKVLTLMVVFCLPF